MERVYLLLGSNLQNPKKQIVAAGKQIALRVGKIEKQSALYETAAWGLRDQPDFLNRVIICRTMLTAEETLETILAIEQEMGRKRGEKNSPRIIDIDILFYGKLIMNNGSLQIPHPRIAERRFVLTPLNELSPRMKHPLLNKTVSRMLKDCTDPLDVKRI